jgi:flagellar biosynthesis protein FlhG
VADRPDVELFREPSEADDRPPRDKPLKVLSVAGAKGGVGKSVVASNLAIYLASIGRRVVLVDADVAGANLHTMLGIERPRPGQPFPVDDDDAPVVPEGWPLQPTSVPNLRLWHAGLDEPAAGERRRERRTRLLSKVRELDADWAVVDLGSGTSSTLVDFHLQATLSLFVALPEPTAIENTYRFLRVAFARLLRLRIEDRASRLRMMGLLQELGGTPPPLDLWRRLEDDGDPMADPVRAWMETFLPPVILNQTRVRADLDLGEAMQSAARRRLGLRLNYLGYIDYDDTVWSCVRSRRQLLVESPGAKSAKSLEKIARRLLAIEAGKGRRLEQTVPPESHHDLLEVERGATDEEVRRAYKRAREIYAPDSLGCYGLFEPGELAHVRRRLDEAHDVLLDPARRRPYELSVFPLDEPEEAPEPTSARRHERLPPPPLITPDTEFHGSLLRAVRDSQGIELREISQRTKVGLQYLVAIEEEDFASLPAPVYVRGFVSEMAKYLRVDAVQASRTYVRRYRRYLDELEGA